MQKNWKKTADYTYTFSRDDKVVGELHLLPHSPDRRAQATLGKQTFSIRRIGFWQNKMEIRDEQENLLMKVYPEKWHSSSYVIAYQGKTYSLVLRNHPLAEWAIMENDSVLLAYGLEVQDGKSSLKITVSDPKSDLLLDYLLWYLFLPIATENCGDDFLFFMLLINQ